MRKGACPNLYHSEASRYHGNVLVVSSAQLWKITLTLYAALRATSCVNDLSVLSGKSQSPALWSYFDNKISIATSKGSSCYVSNYLGINRKHCTMRGTQAYLGIPTHIVRARDMRALLLFCSGQCCNCIAPTQKWSTLSCRSHLRPLSEWSRAC